MPSKDGTSGKGKGGDEASFEEIGEDLADFDISVCGWCEEGKRERSCNVRERRTTRTEKCNNFFITSWEMTGGY